VPVMACASLAYLIGNVFESAIMAMGGAKKLFVVIVARL